MTAASVQHAVAFADGPGGGNPCPVVFGAGDWSDGELRAAAAAFGHETCFVLEPSAGEAEAEADVRLRYFVPNHEMEMCVHATVAAATVLELGDGARVETPLGVRRVWREEDGAALVEQFLPTFGEVVRDVAPVLSVLRAGPESLGAGPIQPVSTARAKLMVPVADEATLDALSPDFDALWSLCDDVKVTGIYAFTLDAAGADAAARQFPARAGYDEDPATGVAACALAAYLTEHGAKADGHHAFDIAQGRAMGRPSRITTNTLVERGAIASTRVGGAATLVGEREPLARPVA